MGKFIQNAATTADLRRRIFKKAILLARAFND